MSLTTLDLTEARTYSSEPLPPLRPIWIGFVLAFGFLAAEILEAAMQTRSGSSEEINVFTGLAAIVCWIYWLSCVHRFHLVLNQMAPYVAGQSTYPITPGRAVGYHFLPFYNLYWIFKWPSTLANYLRQDLAVDITTGGALGLLLFLGMLLTCLFDGFLGFTVIFLLGLYISRKLRKAMEEHERTRGAAQVFT
jgi:hypothetical protein